MTITTSRPHDDAVVEVLKADPEFANDYLAVALDQADQPGGSRLYWLLCGTSPKRKACLRWRKERACRVKVCTGRSVRVAIPRSKHGWPC
jgi:hypothetical protein